LALPPEVIAGLDLLAHVLLLPADAVEDSNLHSVIRRHGGDRTCWS
jgi:hypothetical protein